MEILTLKEIKEKFPDQWVLVGNPILLDSKINDSILNKLIRGIVLFASKDKRELATKANDFRSTVNKTACIYTGTISANRLFLL